MKDYDSNFNYYNKYYISQILNNIAIKDINYDYDRVDTEKV